MPLCQACQRVPFRNILKLQNSDRSVDDEFLWFLLDPSHKFKDPFLPWHASVAELEAGSMRCSFCQVVYHHMKDSFHFHINFKPEVDQRLWLMASDSNPRLMVFMGDIKPEVRLSGHFRYKTTPDSSVADCFEQHDPIQNPLHPVVLGKVERWIGACNNQHKGCLTSTDFESPLPTRLLDLSSLPSSSGLRSVHGDPREVLVGSTLKLTENLLGDRGQYIALSYCWGKSLAYTTTTKNLQAHKQDGGIEYAQLPKTLQDAVFLTRYLGIRYLWADCLCILQDDKADWEYEASRMADVYSNAYLTIAATRASHCGEGFLQARKVKDRHVVSFSDEQGHFYLHFYYDDLTMSPGSKESVAHEPLIMRTEEPLLSRVWCLQERVLPIRTLHFASYQMYWECAEHFSTEDGLESGFQPCEEYSVERIANGLKSVGQALFLVTKYKGKETRSFNEGWRLWTRLIQDYTSRNITYQSDKLPALSGVVSALQTLTGDSCLAGIWKSWFLLGLLWRLEDPECDSNVFVPKQRQRVEPWRAPSWSFASLEGVVLYGLLDEPYGDICAELLDCNVTAKGKNPLGELAAGFATIKAPVVSVFNIRLEVSSSGKYCLFRVADDNIARGSMYFDVEVHQCCRALMITPYTGIAIVPVDAQDGMYVRVGAVSVYKIIDVKNERAQFDRPLAMDRDRSLSSALYPEPTVVTLL